MSERSIFDLVQAFDTVFWAGFMLGCVATICGAMVLGWVVGAWRDRV